MLLMVGALVAALTLTDGCGSGSLNYQEGVLGPYQVDIRLGDDPSGKAEQQTSKPDVYEYEEVGPNFVQRRVRYGMQMGSIVWIEVADRPIETDMETENALFETEIERLKGFLGEPAELQGDRRSDARMVRWEFKNGEAVEIKLSAVGRDNRIVRQLTIGREF